jgi:translation elongation factor EF-1beta
LREPDALLALVQALSAVEGVQHVEIEEPSA